MSKIANKVAMRHLMASPQEEVDPTTLGDGTSVIIAIPLPYNLARQFPSLAPEDDSPTHVTIAYLGKIPATKVAEVLQVARVHSADLPARMKARLAKTGVEYFRNPGDNQSVAHVAVNFNADMTRFKINFLSDLRERGYEIVDFNPNNFFPHVTLDYMEGLHGKWQGIVPEGSWDFDEMEVWGLPERYSIPLGLYGK
jgi:2'-5' RNA ligase